VNVLFVKYTAKQQISATQFNKLKSLLLEKAAMVTRTPTVMISSVLTAYSRSQMCVNAAGLLGHIGACTLLSTMTGRMKV